MYTPASFDHIEAHVADVPGYCAFLVEVFGGGRHKVISENGTTMFISPDGLCIEVKRREVSASPVASGICNPCLRREGAKGFIEQKLGLRIEKAVENPSGKVYFFTDHEGILWHMKDYSQKDEYTCW
jgi:hypothetical protein